MVLFKKILKWTGIVLGGAFVILVIVRAFYFYNLDKTNEQVDIIHNTKLRLSDVMGENLPPDPGELADATVEGVDANYSGIRDDVELAIFAKYPNSAKTRAVLLQYALALQMEVVQPIVNTDTVTEIITEQGRADTCVSDVLVPRIGPDFSREYSDIEKIDIFINFVKNKQFNTEARIKHHENFLKDLRSYGDSTNEICDIDISELKN
jgi:hypothetical protein